MVSDKLKWVLKEKEYFKVDTGKVKNDIYMHKLHQPIK